MAISNLSVMLCLMTQHRALSPPILSDSSHLQLKSQADWLTPSARYYSLERAAGQHTVSADLQMDSIGAILCL